MRDPTDQKLPHKLPGRFWFPHNSNLVLTGHLLISAPHNYDLELDLPHHGLGAPGYWESLLGKPIPVMFGISEERGKLTCIDCGIYASTASYNAPRSVGWHKLRLFTHRCLIGAHVADQSSVKISQFSCFFTGFNQWALSYDQELFSEHPKTEVTIIKRSDAIDRFGRLKIWRAFSEGGFVGDIGKETRIRYWRPSFEPVKPISIDEMLEIIRAFQFLIALLQGRAVGFNDVRAEVISNEESDRESESRDLEVMPMMTGYHEMYGDRTEWEPLLPLKEIGEYWPALVSAWFESGKSITPPLNLYFAVLFVPELFDEQKFLFLAHASEGYHRCKVGKEISFLDRLTEMTTPSSGILSIIIPDLRSFLDLVRDVRNELTHPGLNKVDVANIDIGTMWKQLKTAFEICVLRDLGVPADALLKIAMKSAELIGRPV